MSVSATAVFSNDVTQPLLVDIKHAFDLTFAAWKSNGSVTEIPDFKWILPHNNDFRSLSWKTTKFLQNTHLPSPNEYPCDISTVESTMLTYLKHDAMCMVLCALHANPYPKDLNWPF